MFLEKIREVEGVVIMNQLVSGRENFVADPFLDGKPVKLSQDGSDVGFFLLFFFSFFHFMTVLAAAFCTACRRLICLGGSPDRRLLQ